MRSKPAKLKPGEAWAVVKRDATSLTERSLLSLSWTKGRAQDQREDVWGKITTRVVKVRIEEVVRG